MDLESLLTTRVVIDELKSRDDQGAFQEIADALLGASIISQKDCAAIRDAFLARERVAATSLGFGMAVPHVFSDKVPSALLIVARSSAGVQMKSPDGRPTRLFFCLIRTRLRVPPTFTSSAPWRKSRATTIGAGASTEWRPRRRSTMP